MKKYDKEFIPYQEALELKELGFDEHCFGWYTWTGKDLILKNNSYVDINPTPAPTFSKAFRWFRKKYKLQMEIRNWNGTDNQWYYTIHDEKGYILPWRWTEDTTHEEAELACLRKLIEIVKTKKI